MRADDERLEAAANKAGVPYFGCDTADHLADVIIEQRLEIAVLKRKISTLKDQAEDRDDYGSGYPEDW